MYQLKPDLDADYILSRYSQEQIMSYYLGIPITLGKSFLSPLREDHSPTCNFFYTKDGTLMLKDFAGYFSGGCFKVVMHMYTCNFFKALDIVAADFGILEGVRMERKASPAPSSITKAATTLQIKKRAFNTEDREFWSPIGISKDTLILFKTYPLQLLWLNGKIIYSYRTEDPAYAYCFGGGEYKIYFPKRESNRFLCNCSVVQGLQIDRDFSSGVVLTKSMKDVMVLHEYGITAVALQSETVYPDKKWIDFLHDEAPFVVSLYDFDRAGVTMANFMRKEYGIHPYFLTDGRYGSIDYGAKDISDLVMRYGKDKVSELVSSTYEAACQNSNPKLPHPRKDDQPQEAHVLYNQNGPAQEIPGTGIPF